MEQRIEEELRAGLARAVDRPPVLPALGEQIVRQGRRVRRRRMAAAGAAVAVVLIAAGALLIPTRHPMAEPADPVPTGPPAVAMTYDDSEGTKVIWPGGERHVTGIPNTVPVATVPEGLLLISDHQLQVLPENGARRTVISGLENEGVAVSADGRFATVTVNEGGRRRLTEVDLRAGQVRRRVPIGPPLATDREIVAPVFYVGDAVMLNIGNPDAGRAARWEPGPDQVVGTLDGYTRVLGGESDGAVALFDGTCTRIGVMTTPFDPWRACGADFIGLSPAGKQALFLSPDRRAVTVKDTEDGDGGRTWHLNEQVRTIGWESAGTILYVAAREPRNVIVRCVVPSGRCAPAGTADDVLPTTLPAYGS